MCSSPRTIGTETGADNRSASGWCRTCSPAPGERATKVTIRCLSEAEERARRRNPVLEGPSPHRPAPGRVLAAAPCRPHTLPALTRSHPPRAAGLLAAVTFGDRLRHVAKGDGKTLVRVRRQGRGIGAHCVLTEVQAAS